jgi:serine/threonine protein kinase
MIQAEAIASQVLPAHPLLIKALLVQHSSSQGAFIISQYGGTSLQQLLGTSWCDSSQGITKRISKARDMLACIALALVQLASLPVPRLHRDNKPGNIVFDAASGLYRLIDFGTMIQADKADFFTGLTFAYIEPAMAQPFGSSRFAVITREGQQAATSSASDIWALCLVALEIVLARLPFELDYAVWYFGERKEVEFLNTLAVWEPWRSTDLSAVAAIDPVAADLLRHGLARDPAQRLTLHQLLRHPFVKDRVAKFRGVAAELQRRTQEQQQRIVGLFRGVAAQEYLQQGAAAGVETELLAGALATPDWPASSSSSSSGVVCEVAVDTSSNPSKGGCRCSSSTCCRSSNSLSFRCTEKGSAAAVIEAHGFFSSSSSSSSSSNTTSSSDLRASGCIVTSSR